MKFGDFVLNSFVSPADPRRTSYVVDHQGSRVECTDGEGKFWWTPVDGLKIIGRLDLKNIKFGEAVEHSVQSDTPDWVCKNCDAPNPPINTICWHCNESACR